MACREAVLQKVQSEGFIGERRPHCICVRFNGHLAASDRTRSVERSQMVPNVAPQSIHFSLRAKCETRIGFGIHVDVGPRQQEVRVVGGCASEILRVSTLQCKIGVAYRIVPLATA